MLKQRNPSRVPRNSTHPKKGVENLATHIAFFNKVKV